MSQTRPIDEHSMHTRTCGEDISFRVAGVDEASCVTSIRNLSL